MTKDGEMMDSDRFALSSIGQIALTCKDLDQAIAFYRDTLGIPFLFDAPDMAFFDLGGIRLMLGVASSPEFDHPASILYYRVDDIQEAHQVLLDREVRFDQEPLLVHQGEDHDLWLAFFRDPEDNVLALMSEVPHT